MHLNLDQNLVRFQILSINSVQMLSQINNFQYTVHDQLGKVDSARAFGLPKWLVNRTDHQLLNVLLNGNYRTEAKNR